MSTEYQSGSEFAAAHPREAAEALRQQRKAEADEIRRREGDFLHKLQSGDVLTEEEICLALACEPEDEVPLDAPSPRLPALRDWYRRMGKSEDPMQDLADAFEAANPREMRDTAPEPLPWLLEDMLPAGEIVLLSGEGGRGKSSLMRQIGHALATGFSEGPWSFLSPYPDLEGYLPHPNTLPAATAESKPWANVRLIPKSEKDHYTVVLAGYEDSPRVIKASLSYLSFKLRQAGVDVPEHPKGLRIMDGDHLRSSGPLWGRPHWGNLQSLSMLMPAATAIMRAVEKSQADLLAVDPLGLAYAGNEVDRAEVSAFMNALFIQIARELSCCVVLAAHPPKYNDNSKGSTYSGSTAWYGSFRAAMFLADPPGKPEHIPFGKKGITEANTRGFANVKEANEMLSKAWQRYAQTYGVLEITKNNAGRWGQKINLCSDRGVFWCMEELPPPPYEKSDCLSLINGDSTETQTPNGHKESFN